MIIFLRPCDRNGIQRLDSIFLENGPWPDPYYDQIRDRVRFFVVECTEGFDNCFCVSMGANKTEDYDLFLRFQTDEILAKAETSEFEDICSRYGQSADFQPEFVDKNKKEVRLPDLERMDNSIFDSELGQEYTDRCIACGRCNLSCPTCSCFTVRDILYQENPQQGERLRFWSGCHLDGFDQVSGGIVFRLSKGDRMRYKTMHKIFDFKKRFGVNMCVGCGRCDNVCPQYLCIGCSECVLSYPALAWYRGEKFFRLLVMGRTGKKDPRMDQTFINWLKEEPLLHIISNTYRYIDKHINKNLAKEHVGYILDKVELNPEARVAERLEFKGSPYVSF